MASRSGRRKKMLMLVVSAAPARRHPTRRRRPLFIRHHLEPRRLDGQRLGISTFHKKPWRYPWGCMIPSGVSRLVRARRELGRSHRGNWERKALLSKRRQHHLLLPNGAWPKPHTRMVQRACVIRRARDASALLLCRQGRDDEIAHRMAAMLQKPAAGWPCGVSHRVSKRWQKEQLHRELQFSRG